MDLPAQNPKGPMPRHHHEYQDAHYHDDSDADPPAEEEWHASPSPARHKPVRRPPARRRRYEE